MKKMKGKTRAIATAVAIAAMGGLLAAPAAAQTSKTPAAATQYRWVAGKGEGGMLLGVAGISSPQPVPAKFAKVPATTTPFTLQAGTGLPPSFYDWIRNNLQGARPIRATIVGTDDKGKEVSRVDLAGATISEVAFPVLERNGREAARITVKGNAAVYQPEPGTPAKLLSPPAPTPWHVSGYRLTLGKLDTRDIPRIKAFSLLAGKPLELVVFTNGATTDAFAKEAATEAAHKGPVGPKSPLDGMLELLASDGRTVLFTILLQGVSLSDVQAQKPAAGAGGAKGGPYTGEATVTARMVSFQYSPAATR